MVSKKAKAEAPGTAPTTPPKTRRAPNRASPLKRPARLTDSSPPLASKKLKQASAQKPNLDLKSHQAATKGSDAAGSMASDQGNDALQADSSPHYDTDMNCDHEGDALQVSQSPRHETNTTSDHEVNETDPINNYEDDALQAGQSPHDEADMASDQGDTTLQADPSPHYETNTTSGHEVNEADPINNYKDDALQGGQCSCYEDDVAKENDPSTTDDQKQPSDGSIPVDPLEGTVCIRWPFTRPGEGDSSHFTTGEYDRFKQVTYDVVDYSMDSVVCLFGDLQNEVTYLIGTCTPIPWDKLTVDAQHELKALGNNIKDYVDSIFSHHPRLVGESLAWHILVNNLFSPDCTDKWYGEAWMNYTAMLAHFRERLKDSGSDYASWFHSWRFESARMTYALNDKSSDPERIKKILMEQLGQVMIIPAQAGERLDGLARKATDLELKMQTSPWCFKLGMHHPDTLERSGFVYTKRITQMVLRNGTDALSKGKPVDIICSPFLRGYGSVKQGVALNDYVEVFCSFDQCNLSLPMRVQTGKTVK